MCTLSTSTIQGCAFCRHAGGGRFAGCGALRCCYRREDGGHLLGLRVADRLLEGPSCDLAARKAVLVCSGAWGRRGAAVCAFWVRLGWAPAMWEGVHVSVRGQEQLAWAAIGLPGGWVWGCGAVWGGLCCSLGPVGAGGVVLRCFASTG